MNEMNREVLAAYSDIILKIYSIKDAKVMTARFLESIKLFVEHDAASVYLYDNNKKKYTSIVTNKLEAAELQMPQQMGISKELCIGENSFLFRDSDFEELGCGKQLNPEFYLTNRFGNALHIILKNNGKNVAIINLYRMIGCYNFTDENIFVCNIFREHLALRYSHELEASFQVKYTVSEVIERYGLTPRETQVLKGMLDGKDNYDISEEMAISTFTIKKHIMNIYKKLDICSRTQLFKKVKEYE